MTTTAIQFYSNRDLNKFLFELKKSIKEPWGMAKVSKETTNKSFLRHNSILFSLFFTDTQRGSTRIGYLTLGIFNSYIKIISVDVEKMGLDIKNNIATQIGIQDKYYSYLVCEFISMVSNLRTFELVKNKDFFINKDLHQQVKDLRMIRPIAIRDKKTDEIHILSRIEINKVNRKTFEFIPPNNVALLLNISKRELELAQKIFLEKINKNFGNKTKCKFENEMLSDLYDYFEHLQTSVIFSYTAVEALCNIAIPSDYEFEIINNKGIKEVWNKSAIERNLKTSEKLKEHLPIILDVPIPTNENFWSRFKSLEDIRNSLIHQRIGNDEFSKSAFQNDFLKESIFDIVYSGFEVIEYFCNANTKHSFFPMGVSNSDIEINEVDDIHERLKKYDNK